MKTLNIILFGIFIMLAMICFVLVFNLDEISKELHQIATCIYN